MIVQITGGVSTFKGEQAKVKVWVQKPSIPPKDTLTVTLNGIDPKSLIWHSRYGAGVLAPLAL